MCTGHVRWANGATVNCAQRSIAMSDEQWTVRKSEVRAVKSECTGLSGAARGQRTSTVNRSKPQWSTDVAGIRQWKVSCPVHHRTVRCAHRQQSQTTDRKWLKTINTPNHLHSSHPSFRNSTFNTRAKAFAPRHSQKIKSSQSESCLEGAWIGKWKLFQQKLETNWVKPVQPVSKPVQPVCTSSTKEWDINWIDLEIHPDNFGNEMF
jgi:hypothetical protein